MIVKVFYKSLESAVGCKLTSARRVKLFISPVPGLEKSMKVELRLPLARKGAGPLMSVFHVALMIVCLTLFVESLTLDSLA